MYNGNETIAYVYEVNLTIEELVYQKNRAWLIDHFHDMVNLNKFDKLKLFSVKNVNPIDDNHMRYQNVVAQYYISDYKVLQDYLEKQAKTMRSQVVERLGHGYSVSRRVLQAVEDFDFKGENNA